MRCIGTVNLPYQHEGKCICKEPHYHPCDKKCFLYGKSKGCNEKCSLEYEHEGECLCNVERNNHKCNKKCSLYGKSGGCNEDCSLEYGHEGECLCTVKKNNHTCKEKCELCIDIDIECGHSYNHNNEIDLICNKCNGEVCILAKKGHLCGGQHNCPEKCNKDGWCEIESLVKEDNRIFKCKSGDEISYVVKFQELKKKKCSIKIPKYEFTHPGTLHSCGEDLIHKCGFQCIQCEYYCQELKGHDGPHNCNHGNIKNSFISISDSKSVGLLKKDNKYYKFMEGEKAIVFLCDEYCREQGQGHTHIFESEEEIKNEHVRPYKKILSSKYIYECKCSYFWENKLKFKGNFTKEEKKKFLLCDWHCNNQNHEIKEYCQLPLWHDAIIGNKIPVGVDGNWISSQGHVFNCKHFNTIYSIFLVDQSGSMISQSIQPITDIKYKMNNLLGCSVEAIIRYCHKRNEINPKELCSLIGFNDKASVIFEKVHVDQETVIKDNCISKLEPKNYTSFYNAFQKASIILDNIDRKEFIPVIILLSDGLDHEYDKTIKF